MTPYDVSTVASGLLYSSWWSVAPRHHRSIRPSTTASFTYVESAGGLLLHCTSARGWLVSEPERPITSSRRLLPRVSVCRRALTCMTPRISRFLRRTRQRQENSACASRSMFGEFSILSAAPASGPRLVKGRAPARLPLECGLNRNLDGCQEASLSACSPIIARTSCVSIAPRADHITRPRTR